MWSRDISLMAAMCLLIAIVLSWLSLGARPAYPQQAIIYGPDGRRLGTAQIDSQGTTTTRNAAGTVVAKEAPTDLRKPHACPFRPPCFAIPTH
jgi:hypothetical protein